MITLSLKEIRSLIKPTQRLDTWQRRSGRLPIHPYGELTVLGNRLNNKISRWQEYIGAQNWKD